MNNFSPTPEQEAILLAATTTTDNLLISALAGAAKTTTLVMIAEALAPTAMLCLAFNKRIATEMQERLPSTCAASTLNSLGHRAWGQTIGRRLTLDDRKCFRLLKEAFERLSPDDRSEVADSFVDILRAIEGGKMGGWVPDDQFHTAKPLLTDDEFIDSWEIELSDLEFELVRSVTIASLREAFKGVVDFADQLLMPTIFPCSFPSYPIVLVDEAQDLSLLNHAMLKKIVGKRRLIAVGDECQSIYGFRGAHENSMTLLREFFSMKELTLSTSFRCPIAVVEAARWRAPHMQWPSWATQGLVTTSVSWTAESLAPDAVILCRNNAPLFKMAIALLQRHRYPQLVGNDVGKSLITTMKKFGSGTMKRDAVLAAIDSWEAKKAAKARRKASVHDQAACMRVFATEGSTLAEILAYAEALLARGGPVKLMTIHKSKGLEFDHVYLLDDFLIKDDQQDQNLKYVAQTRAKSTLTYISTEGLTDD